MEVTLKDLWGAREIFSRMSGMKFKAKTSYKLMKMFDQANHELEPFGKVRRELFEKYGEERDGMFVVKPENMEEFTKEIEELASQKVDLKFTVAMDEIEDADLTPSEMLDIEFLFATPQ